MVSDRLNIGIIGGGIGGVATAAALQKFGVQATLYERANELREAGAGIMLWANSARVVAELGFLEELIANSGETIDFLVQNPCGKVLMIIETGDFEVPSVCIPRATLLSILSKLVPPENIRLGHEFESFRQLKNKVQINFKNGVTAEHDALIGADGIYSRVRTQLFGASQPIYRGYQIWRGIGRYEGHAIKNDISSETWGKGKRFGILNCGGGRFTWYGTANLPVGHSDSSVGRKKELLKMFAGWHAPVEELIESTNESDILKNGAFDRKVLSQWGKGAITLIGDAVHPCTPNLGQGGGITIEDAMVLAKCVAREKDLEAALRRYESLRVSRTKHIMQRSRLMGRIVQLENRLLVTSREFITKLLPAAIFEFNLRRTYSYRT
jgi:2-polyprenyl-6-methoxyphenol hydroxylase-like FAD-dependent oxidoreductase